MVLFRCTFASDFFSVLAKWLYHVAGVVARCDASTRDRARQHASMGADVWRGPLTGVGGRTYREPRAAPRSPGPRASNQRHQKNNVYLRRLTDVLGSLTAVFTPSPALLLPPIPRSTPPPPLPPPPPRRPGAARTCEDVVRRPRP